jgi:hypothetical protein
MIGSMITQVPQLRMEQRAVRLELIQRRARGWSSNGPLIEIWHLLRDVTKETEFVRGSKPAKTIGE